MPIRKMLYRRGFNRLLCGSLLSLCAISPLSALAVEAINIQQARQIVESETGGRVVKSQSAYWQGRTVYRFRVVQQGRIRDLMVDAQSGKIMNPLQGDKNNENSSGRR